MSVSVHHVLYDLRATVPDERDNGDKFERVTVSVESMRIVDGLPALEIREQQ